MVLWFGGADILWLSVRCILIVYFFFKQKTAYEMRISDWSSDVCSSDLTTLRMDVIRDRGVLGREVAGGMIENVYRLQFINTSESPEIGRASCRERVCQYV